MVIIVIKVKNNMGYENILNEIWNNPPKNVPNIVNNLKRKYNHTIYEVPDKAYMLVIELNEGFYGISWVCTKPEYQNKGYMTNLMNKMLKEKKGMFILKTDSATGFYERFGFTTIQNTNGKYIMALFNDTDCIDF